MNLYPVICFILFYKCQCVTPQYRIECEKKMKESLDIVTRLKADQDELLSQLEDEKRKNEDLQFKFEEAAITKADIEV